LEDGTPEAEKASARRDLPGTIAYLRQQSLRAQLFVRTNAAGSHHVEADLTAALETPIDGIIMPKLQNADDLDMFCDQLNNAEKRSGRVLHLIGIIETGRGVFKVEELAAKWNAHLSALAFGAEDYITDIGGRRTPEGLEVMYARSRVLLAARVAGLQALDQVVVNIREDEAFRADAEFGRHLGYTGKMCIVPRQVAMANQIFSPSADEIDRSRRLVEAYEAAQAAGRGAIDFEGSMVDEPLLKRARAILQLAADIHR
jgi:citrate lyase subunit beta/citryl-CoA lyase